MFLRYGQNLVIIPTSNRRQMLFLNVNYDYNTITTKQTHGRNFFLNSIFLCSKLTFIRFNLICVSFNMEFVSLNLIFVSPNLIFDSPTWYLTVPTSYLSFYLDIFLFQSNISHFLYISSLQVILFSLRNL